MSAALMKAIEGDDFADWHEEPLTSYHCVEITGAA